MTETFHRYFFTDAYPPRNHMLRDLSIEVLAAGKEGATIQAPVVSHACSENGFMYVGLLATLVDVLGGIIAIPAISPDWISTSNLSIHTTHHVTSGQVSADGHVLRAGRTSVVIGVEIQAESAVVSHKMIPAGTAMITYSRLPGNKNALQMKKTGNPLETIRFSLRGTGLHEPFMDKAGVRIIDRASGQLILNMDAYVRNSLGSLQGGMTAFLADLAGQYVASESRGKPGQTRDLVVHYMSPGLTGPFQTTAELLRMDHHSALTRTRVVDEGNDHRLMAVVLSTVGFSSDS